MSTKAPKKKAPPVPASIVWFEIPADDPARAKKFYSGLFGWKIKKFGGMKDYWHVDTGGHDKSPDGGLMKRAHPQQPITNYILVADVEAAAAKAVKLGGQICKPKTAVPQMGYFVICQDPEGNQFALWQMSPNAA